MDILPQKLEWPPAGCEPVEDWTEERLMLQHHYWTMFTIHIAERARERFGQHWQAHVPGYCELLVN